MRFSARSTGFSAEATPLGFGHVAENTMARALGERCAGHELDKGPQPPHKGRPNTADLDDLPPHRVLPLLRSNCAQAKRRLCTLVESTVAAVTAHGDGSGAWRRGRASIGSHRY